MNFQPQGRARPKRPTTDRRIRSCARDNARSAIRRDCALTEDIYAALDELACTVTAAFRRHPHINNVLTHLSGANWNNVEQAIRLIFDLGVSRRFVTALAANIIDLICADRGVTGRIVKPYFRKLLYATLPAPLAGLVLRHVAALYMEIAFEAPCPIFVLPAEMHRVRRRET